MVGYAVDGVSRTIALRLERNGTDGIDAEIRFTGVVAYHIEGDCLQNIVSDIIEVSPETIVGDGMTFSERHRQRGWPPGWDPKQETAVQFLRGKGCRCFELNASYGLSGWIAALKIEIFPREMSA
jgi:hypothetical protein